VFKLGKRSIERLQGVHPDLVRVVERAIDLTTVDFTVLEGLRSPERQQTLVASGASQTLNSRHITGHAVDLGAWVDNQVDWSWPLYTKIANAMKAAANELGVAIVWGGDWRTFKDGPHFELDRRYYP
jgi:peptidoglycan L-alanyl-D-glutamate endopeptidase CwlK